MVKSGSVICPPGAARAPARAAAETAAHEAVVEVGEVLTGRAAKSEPGDRLYRIAPRD